MEKPAFSARFRYWFDNTMSRGPIALIGWLALITAMVIFVTALIVWLIGTDSQESLIEQIWAFLMLSLEPDAMTFGHWSFRIATLVLVFTSIFVLSTLIGILTTGIESKLEYLRRGRSQVIESGHTVILGWSPQVFPIISELIIANENQIRPCIVVMGDKDKLEMETEIKDRVGDPKNTRIICRRGNPMEINDLSIASLNTAKSIIILAPPVGDPDPAVIKVILAITKNPQRKQTSYHIVAEIHQRRNLEVATIVGKDEVELIQTRDLIARITAQTCRQSGLSIVYSDLLDFSGDEIYFQAEPQLIGKTFGEALLAYEDSAVIGLLSDGWLPRINPPLGRIIKEHDQIIAISADDDTVILSGKQNPEINFDAINVKEHSEAKSERILVLGWNACATTIISELDHYVAPNSSAEIMADIDENDLAFSIICDELKNIECSFMYGDTTDRETLEQLDFTAIDHIIVLSYSDIFDSQTADAMTLVTLLHLRDIANREGYRFSIVSEMLNLQNRDLAEAARPDDFIVSDRLVSLMLTQVSETKALGPVLASLFDPEGSEVYLRPANEYVRINQDVNFYTIVEAAKQKSEIAIGYRIGRHAFDPAENYGVVLNPTKSEHLRFSIGDSIIVLAER
jgi:voltage-gated potassium channel Kch